MLTDVDRICWLARPTAIYTLASTCWQTIAIEVINKLPPVLNLFPIRAHATRSLPQSGLVQYQFLDPDCEMPMNWVVLQKILLRSTMWGRGFKSDACSAS